MINEQLYINNISVPVESALNVALTKAIQDIKEPNKRKATFSKTVTLPDSKTLRQVFDHVFEINMVDRTFNPLAKADVRYEVASEIILNGYLQLKKITTLDEEKFSFEVALVGELANFFEDIKLLKLEDLDLSVYDHFLFIDVQQDSWDSQIIKNGSFVPFNLGEGYVYALVDYGYSTDSTTFEVNQIGVSIYARQYWVSIFEEAGYTWTSTFLDSTLFKSLIIPASPEAYTLTSTEIEDRTFTANDPELTSTGTTVSNNLPNLALSTRDIIKNTVELTDTGGVYDPVTGEFTCVDAGLYTFEFTVRVNATFTPDNGVALLKCISDVNGYIMLHKTTFVGGSVDQVAATPFWITSDDDASGYFAGARTTAATATYPDTDYLEEKRWSAMPSIYPSTPTAVPRATLVPNEYAVTVTGIEMKSGDILVPSWKAGMYSPPSTAATPVMFADSVGGLYSGQCTLDFTQSSFYSQPVNNTTYVGSQFPISKTIPRNIKQQDFILAFVKMFNLFIEVDPDNPKNLLIEPRDDFYASDVENIHELIDRSKPFEQYPVTDLNALKYIYKYKDDADYFNELYTSRWQESYGEIQVDVTHDFGKDIQTEELLFSPTPSVALPTTTRVLPTIQQRDDSGQPVTTKHNIRILYYGGLKNCTPAWNHQLTTGSASFGVSVPDLLTQYPYAGMWDDPYNPTIDLSFGLVKEVFYDSTPTQLITATDNNLFNAYHAKMIREYTDEDTRIIDCYVDMNQVNWSEWDFTKLYYFGSGGNYAYHRLYKVYDYNPSSANTTKCQFLKIKEASVFIPTFDPIDGSGGALPPQQTGGQIGTGTTAPVLPSKEGEDGNFGTGRTQDVNGSGNTIDPTAKNVEIFGDNNAVWGYAKDISLVNSNGNTIDAGVKNVTLINTDDQVITADNQVWINGQIVSGVGIIEEQSADFTAQNGVGTYEITNSGADITVTLDETLYPVDKTWNFKKMDQGYDIILTPSSSTIDGFSTMRIGTINTSARVKYDGSKFIIV